MNDKKEIQHGIELFEIALSNSKYHSKLRAEINSAHEFLFEELVELYNIVKAEYLKNTYIGSLSEHYGNSRHEDQDGNLTMFRLYGGDEPVAIILNGKPFFTESPKMNIFTSPVFYSDSDDVEFLVSELAESLAKNNQLISNLSRDEVRGFLLTAFVIGTCCLKNKHFKDEREWRVVHNPKLFGISKYLRYDFNKNIVSVPMREIKEANFLETDLSKIVEKIIIGPSSKQSTTQKDLIECLEKYGIQNSPQKVFCSNIPFSDHS